MEKSRISNGFLWAGLAFSLTMLLSMLYLRYIPAFSEYAASLTLLLVAGIFFGLIRMSKEDRSAGTFFGFGKAGFMNLMTGAAAVVCFIPLLYYITLINNLFILNAVPSPPNAYSYGPLPAFLLAALLPALCEELFFRGFILSVTSKYAPGAAIFLNGLLFSLSFLSTDRLPETFILGCVLAFTVLRTKSIFPAVLINFAYKGFMVAAYFWFSKSVYTTNLNKYSTPASVGMLELIGAVAVITTLILFFITGIVLLRKMTSFLDDKRRIYGLGPEEETPVPKDRVPAAIQLLAVLPGLAVFVFVLFRQFFINLLF